MYLRNNFTNLFARDCPPLIEAAREFLMTKQVPTVKSANSEANTPLSAASEVYFDRWRASSVLFLVCMSLYYV